MNSQDLTDAAVQLKATATAIALLGDTLLPSLQGIESNVANLVTRARDHALAARAAAGITTGGGGSVPTTASVVANFFTGYAGKKVWLDPSQISSLFQDTGTGSPITATNQPTGRINDLSGQGNNFIQSTNTKKPTYKVENGRSYISADGIDDCLISAANIDLSGTNKLTMIFGLRKRAADNPAMITEFGGNLAAAGTFGLFASKADPQSYFNFGASGANGQPTPVIASDTPDVVVLTCQVDLSNGNGWSVRIQRNNTTAEDSSIAGNRNFANIGLNLFSRDTYALFAPVDLYSFMLLGGAFPSASELLLLRSYTADRIGLTL